PSVTLSSGTTAASSTPTAACSVSGDQRLIGRRGRRASSFGILAGLAMGLFDFFRKPRPARPATPARAAVRFDEEAVVCTRPNGVTERVRWADLRAVLIRTTAAGPAVDDLFWVLVGRNAESGCVVPSEAVGCDRLLERLQGLPGFDNHAVILASQCVEEQTFRCWEGEQGTL